MATNMTINHDTIRYDDGSGMIVFELSVDDRTLTIKFSDIFFQDCFSCCEPTIEYRDYILNNLDTVTSVIDKEYTNEKYPDKSTMVFNDF